MSHPGRRRALEILLASGAYLASRVLVLLAELDLTFTLDELYAGAAARELGTPGGLPLALVAHAPYCGGPILIAAISALLSPLLGESLFTLRLFSLLVSLATFLGWLWLAERLLGRRAALFLTALYVLAPPYFVRLGVMAWGNHAESTLPSVLGLVGLVLLYGRDGELRAPARGSEARTRGLALGIGLANGLALFFSYAALSLTLAMAALVLGLGRAALRRGILASLTLGLVLGALPALWLQIAWSGRGLSGLAPLARPSPLVLPAKLARFLLVELRAYLSTPGGEVSQALSLAFWLAALAALLSAAIVVTLGLLRRRIVGLAVFLLPVLVFALSYAASDIPVDARSMGFMGYRYFAIVTPPLLALIAALLASLPARARKLLLVLLLLPPSLHVVGIVQDARLSVFREPPRSYYSYGIHVFEAQDYSLGRSLAVLRAIADPGARRAALEGLATIHVAWALNNTGERSVLAIERYLARELPQTGPHAPLFAGRLALALASSPETALEPDELDRLAPLAMRALPDPATLTASLVLLMDTRVADPEALRAALVRLPRSVARAGLDGLGQIAARRSEAGRRPIIPWPADPDERVAFAHGFALESVRAALAARRPLDPSQMPVLQDVERAAAARAASTVLRWFEPESPRRRRELAHRSGLAPLGLDFGRELSALDSHTLSD